MACCCPNAMLAGPAGPGSSAASVCSTACCACSPSTACKPLTQRAALARPQLHSTSLTQRMTPPESRRSHISLSTKRVQGVRLSLAARRSATLAAQLCQFCRMESPTHTCTAGHDGAATLCMDERGAYANVHFYLLSIHN